MPSRRITLRGEKRKKKKKKRLSGTPVSDTICTRAELAPHYDRKVCIRATIQCFVPRPVNDEFNGATPQRRLQSPGSQADMEIVIYHTAVSSLTPNAFDWEVPYHG